MTAHQVLNDRTIYEPCLPDGSGHNDCIARAEDMKPCDCTCHLGVIVTTNKPHESEHTERDEEYRKAAKAQYQDEGSIEIDDNAIVSRAHDHAPGAPCNIPGSADAEGAYVAAWMWITAEEAEGVMAPDDPSPDPAICARCGEEDHGIEECKE